VLAVVKQSTEVDESPAASPCYPPYRKFDVWMVEEWYAGCVWMVSMRLAFDNAASLFSTKIVLMGHGRCIVGTYKTYPTISTRRKERVAHIHTAYAKFVLPTE
jgi:hypothetical protein